MKKFIVVLIVMFVVASCSTSLLQRELDSINEQCPMLLASGNEFRGVEIEGDYVVAEYVVIDYVSLSDDCLDALDFTNPYVVELCNILCKNNKGLKIRCVDNVFFKPLNEYVLEVEELRDKGRNKD